MANPPSLASIFTDLVKSFVSDILMPPISVILPLRRNIEEKFAVLRLGNNYNATTGYNTLRQAQEDGAVVMAYGYVGKPEERKDKGNGENGEAMAANPWAHPCSSFIYQVVSFIMVGVALYSLAHLYTLLSTDPIIKHMKKCKYCKQRINEKVHCPFANRTVCIAAHISVPPLHPLLQLA